MLEDEGLVRADQHDGSRVFELTDAGHDASQQAAGDQRAGGPPWGRSDEQDDRFRTLRESVGQVAAAARQVAHAGRVEQLDRTIEILQRTRRELYQLLAEE